MRRGENPSEPRGRLSFCFITSTSRPRHRSSSCRKQSCGSSRIRHLPRECHKHPCRSALPAARPQRPSSSERGSCSPAAPAAPADAWAVRVTAVHAPALPRPRRAGHGVPGRGGHQQRGRYERRWRYERRRRCERWCRCPGFDITGPCRRTSGEKRDCSERDQDSVDGWTERELGGFDGRRRGLGRVLMNMMSHW